MAEESSSLPRRTPAVRLTDATARTGTGQHSFILPPVIAVHRTANDPKLYHHINPLTTSKPLSVSPSLRDGAQGTTTEGRSAHGLRSCAEEQQVKAARKRELARRHLSNSLQGSRNVLPVLRRTLSCSMCTPLMGGLGRRGSISMIVADKQKTDTRSLGLRKPPRDVQVAATRRRSHSLVEESAGTINDPIQRLSLPLTFPHRPLENRVSLATLIHELNATIHVPLRDSSKEFSDDDEEEEFEESGEFDYDNDLDPDLCPRLTGRGKNSRSTPQSRTLTPALRKLNRRKMSSRIRTQHWVDQIEGKEHWNKQKKLVEETDKRKNPPLVALELEQEI